MPKIDVTQVILTFGDEPVMISKNIEEVKLCESCEQQIRDAQEEFTLRMAITRSLTAITEKTRDLSGEKKFERGQLAHKVYNDDKPHLSSEEIVTIKDALAIESPLIVFRAYEMIDPKEKNNELEKQDV